MPKLYYVFELEQPASDSLLYEEECALLAGCLPSTWRAMVSRRQAPPSRGFSPETGRRVWDASEVLRWQAYRPGRGNWARGRARTQPSTRLSAYSLGSSPAWQPPSPQASSQGSQLSHKPWVTPRLPSLPSDSDC